MLARHIFAGLITVNAAQREGFTLKYLLLGGLCLAVAGCASTGSGGKAAKSAASIAAPDAAAQAFPTDFRRLTLIVEDIDESLKLYRDVLEFNVNYDTVVTMSGVSLPAGEPGTKARLVLLSSNDSWVGWIGMLQWLDPALPPRQDKYSRLGIGDPVLVFNTEKVDEHCEMAEKVPGIKMTNGPKNTVYPARTGGEPITVRTCYLFDRDGYFMELNKVLDRASYK